MDDTLELLDVFPVLLDEVVIPGKEPLVDTLLDFLVEALGKLGLLLQLLLLETDLELPGLLLIIRDPPQLFIISPATNPVSWLVFIWFM